MKLSVKERILILGLLPKETNFVNLKVIRDLENEIGLKENEIKEYGVEATQNEIIWKINAETEIEISDKAREIIKAGLQKLDEAEKLTKNHLELCDKFLG